MRHSIIDFRAGRGMMAPSAARETQPMWSGQIVIFIWVRESASLLLAAVLLISPLIVCALITLVLTALLGPTPLP